MTKNSNPIYIGTRYERLTVIGVEEKAFGKVTGWVVRCDCGNEKVVRASDVKSGKIKSCGCLHNELAKKRATKFSHGTVEYKRLYRVYNWMKRRCYDESTPRYQDYGGRGIRVCDEWMDKNSGFDRFAEWALNSGYSNDLTIDRIDVEGDYSPENCAWKTAKEQNANKRTTVYVEYHGERVRLLDLCKNAAVSYDTVHDRIFKRGWDVERAINQPSAQSNSLMAKCKQHGINYGTVRDRIYKFGWSEEDALNTPSVGRGAHRKTYK